MSFEFSNGEIEWQINMENHYKFFIPDRVFTHTTQIIIVYYDGFFVYGFRFKDALNN